MSMDDFNRGLIIGLALKGSPYGNAVPWQPKSIYNENTSSIVIEFDRDIPDLEAEQYVNALFFTTAYIYDQIVLTIKGFERISQRTIRFLLDDYFSSNGIITIAYNSNYGNLNALPNFIISYQPTGIPRLLYYSAVLGQVPSLNLLSLYHGFHDSYINELRTPINSSPNEDMSSIYVSNISLSSLYTYIDDSSLQTILE